MLQSDCNGISHGAVLSIYFSAKKFFTSDQLAHPSEDVPRYHILLEPAHTIFAQACSGVLLRSDDRVNETPLVKYSISCVQTALNKLGVGLVPSTNDRQVVENVRIHDAFSILCLTWQILCGRTPRWQASGAYKCKGWSEVTLL